jgi:hypothetical protein
MRSSGHDAAEARELTADMVEDTVENDPQASAMRSFDQRVKVSAVAETRIDLKVVDRVIAMRGGGENRPEQKPGCAKLNGVIQPGFDMAQPMDNACPIACVGFGACKPERIDLPKHRVFDPSWHLFSFGAMGDNALPRHHPRKRVNQYSRAFEISCTMVMTGYSAFGV